MNLRVQLFGILADRIGQRELHVVVPSSSSVAALLDRLGEDHAAIAAMRDRLAVAVNLEYVKADHALSDGDEVAIIPPVSGG